MMLDEQWDQVREIASRGQRSSGHFAIASVDTDGMPNISPVGYVFLRDDGTAFYFEKYTAALARNLDADPRVCMMSVNRGLLYWFRSLLLGRFATAPGVRLYGTAGLRRPATAAELDQLRQRIGLKRLLKGGKLLWSDMANVRDITFTDFRLVRYPVMMDHL